MASLKEIKRIGILSFAGLTAVAIPCYILACDIFEEPRIDHLLDVAMYPRRLDRCAYVGSGQSDCSKAANEFAANSFCKYKGFSYAAKWRWRTYSNPVEAAITKKTFDGGYEFSFHQGASLFEWILCR